MRNLLLPRKWLVVLEVGSKKQEQHLSSPNTRVCESRPANMASVTANNAPSCLSLNYDGLASDKLASLRPYVRLCDPMICFLDCPVAVPVCLVCVWLGF